MTKIVIDANVLISAAFGGTPLDAVSKAFSTGEVFLSPEVIKEIDGTIRRLSPKLGEERTEFLLGLWREARIPLYDAGTRWEKPYLPGPEGRCLSSPVHRRRSGFPDHRRQGSSRGESGEGRGAPESIKDSYTTQIPGDLVGCSFGQGPPLKRDVPANSRRTGTDIEPMSVPQPPRSGRNFDSIPGHKKAS